MKFWINLSFKVAAFGIAMLFVSGVAAQPATQKTEATFAAKYEGTVKGDGGDVKLKLDIAEDAGEYSGTLTTPSGVFKIIKGQMVDGTLTLDVEKPGGGTGTMTLRRNGNNVVVAFSEAGKNMAVDLHKVVADEISGEWDAIADAQGQPFPFTLTLKLEGEKISGTSASQLGTTNISSGSWKDGKLALVLEGGSGQIALAAAMIEGKLSGEYDFAGQMQGKWVAIKKK